MDELTLFSPLVHTDLTFKNRIWMAPMTRSRAIEQIPNALMATYYSQRASAGLIFSEGITISSEGVGYIHTPGLYTQSHMEGWKKVTQSVHEKGGLLFAQLWHVGRVSHPDFHQGALPVAPSAVGFKAQVYTPQGFKETVVPRALSLSEIQEVVQQYKKAAELAMLAGFDGVEVHAANGYLPHQFLEDGSNQRTDIYGGSIENRSRFLLEIVDALISVWGAARVSVRLSPKNPFNGMHDTQPEATYLFVARALNERKVGMLHLVEPTESDSSKKPFAEMIRNAFSRILVLNKGYDKDKAERAIQEGRADAISFGTLFISNPDLPFKMQHHVPLTPADTRTYYTGNERGYIDYPFS